MNKSKKVYDIFQNISPYYDRANDRISLGLQKKWKNKFVGEVLKTINEDSYLLDLCCGTGDIGLSLKEKSPARVVGVDFSENMLKIAKDKAKGLENISFVKADAKKLPFPDGTFDNMTISFGLRNTDDYKKVLEEMVRVGKDGASIYVIDSFSVENILVKPFYTLFFKYLMPFLGGGFKRYRDYAWLYESTKVFISPKALAEMFQSLGLKNIELKKMLFGACVIVKGEKIKPKNL